MYLVGPADEVELVLLEEDLDDFGAEDVGHSSLVFCPALDVFLGVGPEEVAEEAGVGDVGGPHDPPDLFEVGEFGGEPAVHAEDLLVDDCGHGEAVEAVGEGLPELDGVPALDLIVEAVDAVDAGALVVAPEEEEVLGVLDLVGQHQADGLQRLLP